MKFLKMRITRVIALIISCVLAALCVMSVTKGLLSRQRLIRTETDYMSSYDYAYDLHELYRQLWIVGNMYLRNLDKNGDFKGSAELKTSTESVLHELGLMDNNGNITVEDNGSFEYYVSWDGNKLSNSEKNSDELYDAEYALMVKNGNFENIPDNLIWWCEDYYWYSTNYGMYYYYFGQSAAVFDYDISELDYYYDDYGAKIYYKTDGTTPPHIYNNPDDSSLYEEYDEYVVEEPTMAQDEPENVQDGDILVYNQESGKWIPVDNDRFVSAPGDEAELTICIIPNNELIYTHEQAMLEYSAEEGSFVQLLVKLLPFAAAALILMIYVLITGGYSVKEGRFVLGRFDRVFGELPILCIFVAFLGGGALIAPDVFYALNEFFTSCYNSDMLMPIAYSIAYALIFAIITVMLNTLVIRLKCRSFWKTTLVGRISGRLFRQIKKIFKRIRKEIISREMLRNDIFTKRFIMRLAVFVLAEAILIPFCIDCQAFGIMVIGSLLLLFLYVFLSFRDLSALKKLSEQISDINGGDYSRREVPEGSVTYGMTEKLNNISDGIQTAVDRQVKSERMKIDLVTNVSHDLKTPLTSIISYINLLTMEELTPAASDYVKILEQKSERLAAIVSDLFDLAKATSRTDICLEVIDAVILVGQVLGDMSDKISSSGMEIRTDISMESAPIYAEGKKLYRVLQNLIDNALKYSLDGTRIYLTLREEGGKAVILLKNISSYEMKFTPEEITERFTRGDESRTSEGNGLGLSIAKSFTEACGGEFRIIVDGDVFSAEIKLPLTVKKEESVQSV